MSQTELVRDVPPSFARASSLEGFFSFSERENVLKNFEKKEHPAYGKPGASCNYNLFFGFFFDGTRNNYKLAEAKNTHSNVARLYDCFPGQSVPGVLPKSADWDRTPEQYQHFFKVYVPGVGTPFEQVGDPGAGAAATLGAAVAHLGKERIVWALIQAINNVHRFFHKKPLVESDEARRITQLVELDYRNLRQTTPVSQWRELLRKKDGVTRQTFESLLQRLHSAISPHWVDRILGKPPRVDPGIVESINMSIFGFSRGATKARAFANWLVALCKLDAALRGKDTQGGEMTLGGFPVTFQFLGLFDTVASVGSANSFGDQLGLGSLDGHGEWADAEYSLRIPQEIPCLHLVAAHEVRRSFPLDSVAIGKALPPKAREIVFPGVHSDVGGGYAPKEQGKGVDAQGSDMISRIALVYMYREARLSGVPLKLELTKQVAKDRFNVAPGLITAFNNYLAHCKVRQGSLTSIFRDQRRLYIQWRLARHENSGAPLEKSDSFLRASPFEQNDLNSANREFGFELQDFRAWLKDQGPNFRAKTQAPGFDNERNAEWEEMATWWSSAPPLPSQVLGFFDDYVHDSRAWFKLIPLSPDSEEDMYQKLQDWLNDLRAHRSNRWRSHSLSPGQIRMALEFERTGKIPRTINEGREPYLSAKAGYLRYRKIYAGGDGILVSHIESPEVEDQTAYG